MWPKLGLDTNLCLRSRFCTHVSSVFSTSSEPAGHFLQAAFPKHCLSSAEWTMQRARTDVHAWAWLHPFQASGSSSNGRHCCHHLQAIGSGLETSFQGNLSNQRRFRTHGWTGPLSCPLWPGAPQSFGEPDRACGWRRRVRTQGHRAFQGLVQVSSSPAKWPHVTHAWCPPSSLRRRDGVLPEKGES